MTSFGAKAGASFLARLVELMDDEDGRQEVTYTIVGEDEADIGSRYDFRKFSDSSGVDRKE